MKRFSAILCVLCAFALNSVAQTNQWFKTGDLTVGAGLTISFPSATAKSKADLYGFTYQTTYWQTIHTGTGLEIGKRNFSEFNAGYIDHVSAMEYYRVVPFAASPILGRFQIEGYTGAETWFDDGTKGLVIGGGAEFALWNGARLFGQFGEGFETTAQKSGSRANFGFNWSF